MKSYRFLQCQLIALAIAVGLGVIGCSRTLFFEEEYKRFESVKVGMSDDEVEALLGEPTHVYSTDDAPKSYYVKGYSFKKRNITHKVMIYIASEAIGYVYIDEDDRVEEVFVGGS